MFSKRIQSMTRTLLLDFDGTLIDSRRRLYGLFRELVPSSDLSFEQYWDLKRQGLSQPNLLRDKCGMDPDQIDRFRLDWMERVEDPDRLALDQPLVGVGDFLERVAGRSRLVLVTGRQHADRARDQIGHLGWAAYFSLILVTAQRKAKASLVLSHLTPSPDDWMVGDSGEDILAGRELGVKTAGVLTGPLSPDRLHTYNPDTLLKDVTEIEPLI